MPNAIDDVALVEHTCVVAQSPEHVWEAAARWVSHEIDHGRRVLYFEDETADRLLDRLDDDGMDVDAAIGDGALSIIPTGQTRAVAKVPLSDAEQMMRTVIAESETMGFSGTGFIGETTRCRYADGLANLLAYEQLMERVLGEFPQASRLCLFDPTIFDNAAVAAVRAQHRTELVGAAVFDDGLLRVTAPVPTTLRLAGELDYSNVVALARMIDGLLGRMRTGSAAGGEATLDLSSLRFLDARSATTMLGSVRDLSAAHRVVLAGPRPRVQRLLQRCGLEHWERVVVRPRTARR